MIYLNVVMNKCLIALIAKNLWPSFRSVGWVLHVCHVVYFTVRFPRPSVSDVKFIKLCMTLINQIR